MSEARIKLVLDTNTIISGLLFRGNEFKLLEAIEAGKASLFMTKEILQEIDKVLHYERLEKYILKSGLSVERLLEKVISFSNIIFGHKTNVKICRDPTDNKFLECAEIADVRYLVSGDDDLLSLKKYEQIEIITTREALNLVL